MYIPKHFNAGGEHEIAEFVERYSFGTLITPAPSGIQITHLPFLVDKDADDLVLRGHFARANPHASLAGETDSVAIFHGPHCYISPNWYASRQVPTWNYAVLHCHGGITMSDDHATIHDIVLELSDQHELNLDDPWIPDYDDAMLNAIVGFEMTVKRTEFKHKLSQNKSVEDRRSAIDALRASGYEDEQAIADLMERTLAHAVD